MMPADGPEARAARVAAISAKLRYVAFEGLEVMCLASKSG